MNHLKTYESYNEKVLNEEIVEEIFKKLSEISGIEINKGWGYPYFEYDEHIFKDSAWFTFRGRENRGGKTIKFELKQSPKKWYCKGGVYYGGDGFAGPSYKEEKEIILDLNKTPREIDETDILNAFEILEPYLIKFNKIVEQGIHGYAQRFADFYKDRQPD